MRDAANGGNLSAGTPGRSGSNAGSPGVRVGPRMRELQSIVSAMPGTSKAAVLRAADLPTHGLGSGR